ncbi:CidA/LrgA family protein [Escherichia coli]|uniref:CidA/LrgA family protein n=1 Tax=Escherichia coli TaxID=562 RepID=UPI000CFDF1C1|nr:CidA/LrgA family protein [Escherichia coli]
MNNYLSSIIGLARAFILIYICLYIGVFISLLLPIMIPGSIIGLIILFILLCIGVVKPAWVNPGCSLLISYMALLFVPVGVGVMQYVDVLRAQFLSVVVSCIISTVMVLVLVSFCSHIIHQTKEINHD